MRYRLRSLLIVLAVGPVVLAAGCANQPKRFSGRIAFANRSGRLVRVESVQGFEREPPVGVLTGDGSTATADMNSMTLPKNVVVTWEDNGTAQSTAVPLAGLSRGAQDDKLLIEFDGQKWSARFAAR